MVEEVEVVVDHFPMKTPPQIPHLVVVAQILSCFQPVVVVVADQSPRIQNPIQLVPLLGNHHRADEILPSAHP
jgi:hypothetical protein